MTISVNVVCRRDKANKNGTVPVHLRFTQGPRIRYVSTGIAIVPTSWDAQNQRLIIQNEESQEMQYRIDSLLAEYHKRLKRLEVLEADITLDNLLETNGRKNNCTIAEYFAQAVTRLQAQGKINTAAKYRFTQVSLQKALPPSLRFDELTLAHLHALEQKLHEAGCTSNSIATKISVLKAVYNKALADKVFICKENPFTIYKVGRLWTQTRKRAVHKEDIQRLMQTELPATHSPYIEFARDIFLFSYFTEGINFKDIATLRHCNIEGSRVYYTRHKTGKQLSCPLTIQARQIIAKYTTEEADNDQYVFPILDRKIHRTEQQMHNRIHKVLTHVNKGLREWSRLLGLKTTLTTYVARHTFASVLKRSGVSVALISESLGHSDLSTTQIYLDAFENSQIDEALKNLL